MWAASGKNIKMTEGDWGVELPLTVNGITFAQNDELLFTLKTAVNGDTILTKNFENIQNSTVKLTLTEAESAQLTPKDYVYSLDWYQDGVFLCNVIPNAQFSVVDKA